MISSDVQSLSPGDIIDLYELDATNIEGGSLLRWCNFVNELGNSVVWGGDTYTRLAIETTGFEKTSDSKQPRPKLRVSNVTGLIGSFARSLDGLIGAKLTRHRTFVKYIDAVNFTGGTNPIADPNASFTDEIWYVDRKASENGIFVEFELASSLDLSGIKLPRRQVVANTCTWVYRSAECGYAGGAVATFNDEPTTVLANDSCGKRLSSCQLRFGTGEKPYGGFPGVTQT